MESYYSAKTAKLAVRVPPDPTETSDRYLAETSMEERREEKTTQQTQRKAGSRPIRLAAGKRGEVEGGCYYPWFKAQIKSITWLESGQRLWSVGGNEDQQKTSSSCCVC